MPIYVGKADPDNPKARTPNEQGLKLSGRLKEHRKNIERATSTLRIDDFDCRFLVVQSGWEKSAECYLINFFEPIWNSETKICFGLGKHGDAAATRANKRSPWDTLHPGRKWAHAESLVDAMSENQIKEKINAHFAHARENGKLYENITDVLNAFIQGLKM